MDEPSSFFSHTQKGPWEGWVWGAWGICSGCAHQQWRGEGERKFSTDFIPFLCCCHTFLEGSVLINVLFCYSGKGWRSEDHRLQTRPQQGVRLENEDISDVLQWDGETFWYDAFHPKVVSYIFRYNAQCFLIKITNSFSKSHPLNSIALILCLFRAFEDEGKARLGVVECAKHELLQPFNVLHEKEGEWNKRSPGLGSWSPLQFFKSFF